MLVCCTDYQPTGDYGGFPHGGYTDTQVNSNTAVVTFTGNIFSSQGTIADYALYRCAKVAMERGYNYFVVTSTSESSVNVNVNTHTDNRGYVSDPAKLHDVYPTVTDYSSYSTSRSAISGKNNPCGSNCGNSGHGAVIVIKMFQGNVPSGLPRAYNVNDVIAHLGSETL